VSCAHGAALTNPSSAAVQVSAPASTRASGPLDPDALNHDFLAVPCIALLGKY